MVSFGQRETITKESLYGFLRHRQRHPQLREAKCMTQAELAEKLAVSAKAISKWETAHGLPDISLLEPLAAALGVSVLELMQGEPVVNRNRSANLLRSKLYVCPCAAMCSTPPARLS